ncbi:hypothetical protein DENSPDRAFT_886192 [Dentipellis sp. KUC8613]|nr:hypothetical protein DENSPDRAFT_886192 [Dentipellis sp. KUC8613]
MVSSRTVRTISRVRFSLARPCSCPSASPFACAHLLRAVPLARLSLSPHPCRFVPPAPPRVVLPALSHLAPAHYVPSLRRHAPCAAVARCLDPRHALSRAVARRGAPSPWSGAPWRSITPRYALSVPMATPSCRATLPRCACAPHHVVWTPAMPRAASRAISHPVVPCCALWHRVAPRRTV